MRPGPSERLALIVRNHPWRNRAARADLDVALAAAAMDFGLEVYFLGSALLQLARERDPSAAMLPVGYRAWAALPDLAEAAVYAERGWFERLDGAAIQWILPVQTLSAEAMSLRWRRCNHVLMT
jgi:sulfur relay (sulfurtransferase) DsrF/TusC family protein